MIEIQISTKNDHQSLFYLHFEFIDFYQAKQFINEFMDYFNSLIVEKRILIICSSGITSTFFAFNLEKKQKRMD